MLLCLLMQEIDGTVCILQRTNVFREGLKLSVLPPVTGKMLGRLKRWY